MWTNCLSDTRRTSTKCLRHSCSVLDVFRWFLLLLNIILLSQISTTYSDRVKQKIYNNLDSSFYCFRRLNRTHQIGCSSPESGSSGIIKLLRDNFFNEDLEYITTKGPDPPYVSVLSGHHFNLDTLLSLKKSSNRVAGVLVLDTERPPNFSSDRSCPNELFSLYVNDSDHKYCKSQQWNKPTITYTDGIMFHDWPFPIFLLRNKTEIEFFLNKTKAHSNWPKLAVELTSPMSAGKNSVTCMRRSDLNANSWFSLTPETYCDPIGGINIYHHTLNSSIETLPPNSLVVLASRLDSFSMFDGLAPGADSALSSLIVQMAIAEMLNRDLIKTKLSQITDKGLLFALFDGEAFDYIGSSHAAYQMANNSFSLSNRVSNANHTYNLNLNHLSHFIELNQLAHYNGSEKLNIFLHKHLKSTNNIDQLIQTIKNSASDLNNIAIESMPDNHPLPPSSAQSFLKLRNDVNFSAIVATNHKYEYVNKHYNSFYEDGVDIKYNLAKYLEGLATLFSRVAYKLVTGLDLDRSERANITLIDGLINCFLQTSSCEYFQFVQEPSLVNRTQSKYEPTFPSYVSVYGEDKSKVLRQYTHALFHYLTGEIVEANSLSDCRQLGKEDKQYTYLWQNGLEMKGECVRSTVYTVDSISPAFDPVTLAVVEGNLPHYALWTESKWKMSTVRMFVVSSRGQQLFTLIFGLVVMLFSFAIVYYFTKNASLYFDVAIIGGDGGGVGGKPNDVDIDQQTSRARLHASSNNSGDQQSPPPNASTEVMVISPSATTATGHNSNNNIIM